MWRRRKRETPQKTIDTLIGAGTSVLGNVTFTGGLRIDGKVLGNVIAVGAEPCTLVIGEHAEVQGEVRVSHVVVNGKIVGPVMADGVVELQAKARVTGDVSYKTLEMHVGAVLRGRLNHAEPGIAPVVELKRAGSD